MIKYNEIIQFQHLVHLIKLMQQVLGTIQVIGVDIRKQTYSLKLIICIGKSYLIKQVWNLVSMSHGQVVE